jgi:hypothetical protein
MDRWLQWLDTAIREFEPGRSDHDHSPRRESAIARRTS